MSEWKPISEAPKDGTPFLVYAPNARKVNRVLAAYRYNPSSRTDDILSTLGSYVIANPTHWIAPPPSSQQTGVTMETMLSKMCAAIASTPATTADDVRHVLTEAAIERLAKAALQAIMEPSEQSLVASGMLDVEGRELARSIWRDMSQSILAEEG